MKSKEFFIVKTFCSNKDKGSPQHIHVYDNERTRKEDFVKYDITNDFDHSFISIDDNIVSVNWKNRAGPIQFCGSGAYALAWVLAKKKYLNEIVIKSGEVELEAMSLEGDLVLKIPASIPEFLCELDSKTVFHNPDSGVFLVRLQCLDDLKTATWQSICDSFEEYDIHGLCLFIWDEKTLDGKLRYLVPRYGREEDHVTGSIHQFLTPLIFDLYGIKKQNWTQLSALGGKLETQYCKDVVYLKGNCVIQEDSL